MYVYRELSHAIHYCFKKKIETEFLNLKNKSLKIKKY